jgi:transcriptional regulator with XRE-family HTH domain
VNVVTRAVGLAAMRERRGLTNLELAERLGLSEDQIADLESGHTHAGSQLRLILMRYFDCQFEYLFELLEVNPEH